MQLARQEGKFVDITLDVGGAKISAHRAVLVGLSPYFNCLLTSGLAESTQGGYEVKMDSAYADTSAVEAIVDCMYSGKLCFTDNVLCHVIRTANMLGIDAVEKAACDYLVDTLQPGAACDALAFAASYTQCGEHACNLYQRVLEYVEENFAICITENSFRDLSCEVLVEMIESDDLPVEEETVLAVVRDWFDHDQAGRQGCLQELMPLIRWPLIPTKSRLALPQERLLQRMIEDDSHTAALAMQLLAECSQEFKQSDEAAACPRLQRRKGTKQPVLPLAFTALSTQHYTTEGKGRLVSTTDPIHRPAICRERVMNWGQSCAEITVEQRPSGNIMIGVGRPTLNPHSTGGWWGEDFWGLESGNGHLCHCYAGEEWCDQPASYGESDVVRLLLDSDAGTLTVKLNGTLLGVMVTDLTGDLCWAVSHYGEGVSLRIQAMDPAQF
eukprot:COSAG02_NODE_83_length_39665_cov_25.213719_31_plen_441_part_00